MKRCRTVLLFTCLSLFAMSSARAQFDLVGASFQYDRSYRDLIYLEADFVYNYYYSPSGPLTLELWLSTSPYYGGTLWGTMIAEASIGILPARSYFENLFYFEPALDSLPPGYYYATMILGEGDGFSSYIVDYINLGLQPFPAILFLDPDPSLRNHSSLGASGQNITVTANVDWTASESLSWVTITSGASGSWNGTITYSVNPNTGASRSGTISVSGGGLTQEFTIYQEAAPGSDDLLLLMSGIL